MNPPVSIVARCGVLKRGWTSPNIRGNSPSRAMAMKTRTWLRNVINSTLVMPARPPMAIRPCAHSSDVLCSVLARSPNAAAMAALRSILG